MPAPSPAKAPPPDLSSQSEELGKRWAAATESIRTRTDATAKGLAALGTTAVTAAGLSKFSDIFPLPAEPSWPQIFAIAGLLVGLAAMVTAVGWFTLQLWSVSSPVFMRLNPEQIKDAEAPEREVIHRIYQEAADLNDAKTFEQYARRGLRLQRVAQRGPETDVAGLAATEAKQINADVAATEARALTNVVRKRAQETVRGRGTAAMCALFFVGVLAFGVAADYLESERASRVATAKSCAEAVTAIRTADPQGANPLPARLLPTLCGGKRAVPAATAGADSVATAQSELAGAIKDLATRYDACVTAAKGETAKCKEIRNAVRVAVAQ